jgi:hypothetical protein
VVANKSETTVYGVNGYSDHRYGDDADWEEDDVKRDGEMRYDSHTWPLQLSRIR